jgi:hypothetical protein
MFRGNMRPLVFISLLMIVAGPRSAPAQTTRVEMIERQRAEKAARLETYKPGRLEKIITDAEEGRLRRRIAPYNGFFAEYGYSHKPVGSGIGFGGGFRHDLFSRRARLVLEGGGSFRKYWMTRADFALPRLAGDRLELGVEGLYRHHSQDDFYGLGPDSVEEDRVSYGFAAPEVQGRAIVAVRPWLDVGARLGRMSPSVLEGHDSRFPSIEARFDSSSAPGLMVQPGFTYGEGFAEIDFRDEPGNARAGGHYLLTMRRYGDGSLDRFDFRSVDLLLQHFFPVFDKKRVFAFQFGLSGTSAGGGSVVPFYMQPTLGGSRMLRSAADYRFRDNNVLWMNAEYRWEAFSALDMALFSDWGKVAPRLSDLDQSGLAYSYGIGFRVNVPKAVIMRFDLAIGGTEGIRYHLKYNKAF